MSSFRIRPRFKHAVKGEKNLIVEKITSAIEADEYFFSTNLPEHLFIKIHPNHQHFWSPQLDLTFEEEDENVIIRGLYGPKPTIWAVFFFGYIVLGILSVFVGMWGLSRWSLGMSSGVLWSIPIFALIAIGLYFLGQTGQKLGAQQMFEIHHFYEKTIGDKIQI